MTDAKQPTPPRPEPIAEAELQQVTGGAGIPFPGGASLPEGMTPAEQQAWLDRWLVATMGGEY